VPAGQTAVVALQILLDVAVGGDCSYCAGNVHGAAIVAHVRSVDAVGAMASYCVVGLHGVHAAHTRKFGSEGAIPVTSADTSKNPKEHPTAAVLTSHRLFSHGDVAVFAGLDPGAIQLTKSVRLRHRRPTAPVPDAIVQPKESHEAKHAGTASHGAMYVCSQEREDPCRGK
jgi:hypothetical protein